MTPDLIETVTPSTEDEVSRRQANIEDARATLSRYIGKTLRIHIEDKRVFVGQMKCTDRECNIILGLTQEYRPPDETTIKSAVEQAGNPSVQMAFTNRFVGLVVVPGKYITKIELEEHIPA